MTPGRSTRRTFVRATGSAAVVAGTGCSTIVGDESPTRVASTATNRTAVSSSEAVRPSDPGVEVVEMTYVVRGGETQHRMSLAGRRGGLHEIFPYFDPKGLLVDPGTTIRFVNAKPSHSTTAYHPAIGDRPERIPTDADPWDSGVISDRGGTFEVTLETRGVYDYYCGPHERMGMVGRIVVGAPRGGPGTTPPDSLPPRARGALPAVEAIVERGSIPGF